MAVFFGSSDTLCGILDRMADGFYCIGTAINLFQLTQTLFGAKTIGFDFYQIPGTGVVRSWRKKISDWNLKTLVKENVRGPPDIFLE